MCQEIPDEVFEESPVETFNGLQPDDPEQDVDQVTDTVEEVDDGSD